MTRTPLAQSLIFCHNLSLEAAHRQLPIEQIYEEKLLGSAVQQNTSDTASRRSEQEEKVLHPRPQAHASAAKQVRIAIVGAGIAGLNAALTLHDAGFSSTIYEASNRIGGRMHSDTTTWADGMVTEWCGEFVDSDHEAIHSLITRFGLQTIDLGRATAPDAQRINYLLNQYYSAEQVIKDFQSISPYCNNTCRKQGFQPPISTLLPQATNSIT